MANPLIYPDGQKFRTSCDKCLTSKVKCSQDRPSCWRCSQSGQDCIYSPFRRLGRPPKGPGAETFTVANIFGPTPEQASTTVDKAYQHFDVYDPLEMTSGDFETHFDVPHVSEAFGPELNQGDVQDARTILSKNSALRISSSVDFSRFANSATEENETGYQSDISRKRKSDVAVGLQPRPSLSRGRSDDIQHPKCIPQSQEQPFAYPNQWHNVCLEHLTKPQSGWSPPRRTWRSPSHATSESEEHNVAGNAMELESTATGDACHGGCHRDLSELLQRLGECEDMLALPVDEVLTLSRDVQLKRQKFIHCTVCTAKSNNRTNLTLTIMAFRNILLLMEKLYEAGADSPSQCRSGGSNRDSTPLHDGYPLSVGNYVVDESVKAKFLDELIATHLDKIMSMLKDLSRSIDQSCRDVNSRVAREFMSDAQHRAALLRKRLLLCPCKDYPSPVF